MKARHIAVEKNARREEIEKLRIEELAKNQHQLKAAKRLILKAKGGPKKATSALKPLQLKKSPSMPTDIKEGEWVAVAYSNGWYPGIDR